MLTIITLPEGFTADILTNVSGLLGDLAPYITLILGVVLIGVVLEIIIGAIRKH